MGRQLGEELPLGDTDTSLHLTPTNMQMNTLVMAVFAILFALLLVTTAHPAPDPDALASPVADPHRRRVRPYRRPSYSSHHGGGFGGLGGFGSSYQVGHMLIRSPPMIVMVDILITLLYMITIDRDAALILQTIDNIISITISHNK